MQIYHIIVNDSYDLGNFFTLADNEEEAKNLLINKEEKSIEKDKEYWKNIYSAKNFSEEKVEEMLNCNLNYKKTWLEFAKNNMFVKAIYPLEKGVFAEIYEVPED